MEKAESYLLENEAFTNLYLGISYGLKNNPNLYGENHPYFACVENKSEIVSVVLRSPPYDALVYSHQKQYQNAFQLLVEDLLTIQPETEGINGPALQSEAFAKLWSEATDKQYNKGIHCLLYVLETVIHPEDLNGVMRLPANKDFDIVLKWMKAFHTEATPHDPVSNLEERILQNFNAGNYFLWESEGEVVSVAAKARPLRSGITINSVYTPPEFRKKGYATQLVAKLSQQLLDEGKSFITLYTDLSNPTSNSIYQKIGYKQIGEFANYKFDQGS